jgi:copper chaperone
MWVPHHEAAATSFSARLYPHWVYCESNDEGEAMSETVTYSVPGIHCAHCGMSIREEVSEVEGVEAVDVDLETKVVSIRGRGLSDEKLRTAIQEAGYEAA